MDTDVVTQGVEKLIPLVTEYGMQVIGAIIILIVGKLASGFAAKLVRKGLTKAKGILEEILASHPKVLKDPEPTVAVSELGDSSVNFVVRPWVQAEDYWTVWFDVTQQTKERFDAQGVSIPFPQRDVHLFQEQAS